MTIELKVPAVGESIAEVFIGPWLKKEGEPVREGEPLVAIETDKATMEIPAPVTGTLTSILKREGDAAEVGEVIGSLEEGRVAPEVKEPAAEPEGTATENVAASGHVMPAAERLLAEHQVEKEQVKATGPGGRLLKEDVQRHLQAGEMAPDRKGKDSAAAQPTPSETEQPPAGLQTQNGDADEKQAPQERLVPMSPIRLRIAQRLVEAQQTAALLTTFNEIDMSEVVALRKQYRDAFQEKYGVKLGFMSFFVKAVVDALQMIPEVNAEIRGRDIVYRDTYDIGIAVGGGRGLVVPVLRQAERMSFADIELAISDFARRAADNTLRLDELQGGTFTISNGGVYGSLLSTPIVNPPQSGILGLHKIEERPVARDGAVVIRPMMYVALTYDHRIVDGREAVTFLRRIKETIEQPARLLIEV